ncbi:MAG: hypothetical protein R6U91_04350 [Bacillota bacterium]
MKEKKDLKLTDQILKEAIQHDFESIESPPSEQIWQRIETELKQSKGYGSEQTIAVKRRSSNWIRYGAVAAAAGLVILVLNSLGLVQWEQATSPAMVEDAEQIVDEPAGEMEAEDAAPEALMEEKEEPLRSLQYQREEDHAPPDWPRSLPGDFSLENEILLTTGEGPDYQGAAYRRPEESLLLIKSDLKGEEISDFKNNLRRHLESEIQTIGQINGYTHYEIDGRPGLAWQKADSNYILLVELGIISPEALKAIAEEIE